MELIQPLATTAIRFTQTRPAQVFIPDIIRAAESRYRFWSVPRSLEEYTRADGAEFKTGIFNGIPIDTMRIYNNGILAEGKVHSDRLDDFLDDVMQWARLTFGLEYEPLQPVSRAYTSTVEVACSGSLDRHLGAMNAISERLTSMVENYGFTLSPYQFTAIISASDPASGKPIAPGRFFFDRRAGRPFDSGIYFSEAPVSTDQHIELLNLMEAILSAAP